MNESLEVEISLLPLKKKTTFINNTFPLTFLKCFTKTPLVFCERRGAFVAD